jgi:hypothetical protein
MTEEVTMTNLAPEGKINRDNDEVKPPGRSPNPKDKKLHRLVPESEKADPAEPIFKEIGDTPEKTGFITPIGQFDEAKLPFLEFTHGKTSKRSDTLVTTNNNQPIHNKTTEKDKNTFKPPKKEPTTSCRLESFVPSSAAELVHLTRFRPLGKILLAINGSAVHTVEDIAGCFCFHLERKQGLDSLTLLLVTRGLGENGPDKVDISPNYHAQCRSIFSIDATSLTTPSDAPFIAHIHRTKGDGTSPTTGMSPTTQNSESVAVVATVTAFDTNIFNFNTKIT